MKRVVLKMDFVVQKVRFVSKKMDIVSHKMEIDKEKVNRDSRKLQSDGLEEGLVWHYAYVDLLMKERAWGWVRRIQGFGGNEEGMPNVDI